MKFSNSRVDYFCNNSVVLITFWYFWNEFYHIAVTLKCHKNLKRGSKRQTFSQFSWCFWGHNYFDILSYIMGTSKNYLKFNFWRFSAWKQLYWDKILMFFFVTIHNHDNSVILSTSIKRFRAGVMMYSVCYDTTRNIRVLAQKYGFYLLNVLKNTPFRWKKTSSKYEHSFYGQNRRAQGEDAGQDIVLLPNMPQI